MKNFAAAILTITIFFLAGFSTAHALPVVWGSDASDELIGSRNEPDHLRTYGTSGGGSDPNDWTGYVLHWEITYDANAELWTYTYTSPAGPPPNNSHLWLEITDGVSADEITINGTLVGPQTYSGSSNSDKDGWPTYDHDGLPGTPEVGIPLYALKFDFGPDPYVITTERPPVYGNFFAKGAQSYVWNLGMESFDGTTFLSDSPLDFIVRPDGIDGGGGGGGGGGGSLPEPGTFLLFGAGLAGLALCGRLGKRS